MKVLIMSIIAVAGLQYSLAQEKKINTNEIHYKVAEQEIIQLSKQKWQWMADKNVDSLALLFHNKSVYVHMGGSWDKTQEINVIKSGGIHYKKADIHEVSVNIIDNTAIILTKMDLLAVVGGNEVINPFIVTEVYVKQGGSWKLGSLSFTKTMTSGKK